MTDITVRKISEIVKYEDPNYSRANCVAGTGGVGYGVPVVVAAGVATALTDPADWGTATGVAMIANSATEDVAAGSYVLVLSRNARINPEKVTGWADADATQRTSLTNALAAVGIFGLNN